MEKYIVLKVFIKDDDQDRIEEIAESIKDAIYDYDEEISPIKDVFYQFIEEE